MTLAGFDSSRRSYIILLSKLKAGALARAWKVHNFMRNTTISGSGSGVYCLSRSGKLEEMKPAPALPVGCHVIAVGYAGALQQYAVIDEAQNLAEIAPDEYDRPDDDIYLDNYFSPRQHLDEYARPFSERFGIGFYYDLSAPLYSAEDIAQAIAHAERVERLKAERAAAANRARAELSAKYAREYSYLTRNPRTSREITDNLRKELKKNYPSIKFAVRYKSFSGGDEMTVKWTDGPTRKQVEQIANKYQHSHADHSGDYWDYNPNEFNKLFGGVKFVMVEREMSEDIAATFVDEIVEACPFLAGNAEIHTDDFIEQLHTAPATAEQKQCYISKLRGTYWISARSLARWIHNEIDYTQKADEQNAPEGEPQTEVNDERAAETVADDNGLQLVDYSEKAFVITGDTRDKKDLLKSLGGRFNPRLNCGAGWVFSKLRINEVRQRLGL